MERTFDFGNLSGASEFLSAFKYAAEGVVFNHKKATTPHTADNHDEFIQTHPAYNRDVEQSLEIASRSRGVPPYENCMLPMIIELARRLTVNAAEYLTAGKLLKEAEMTPLGIAILASQIVLDEAKTSPLDNPLKDLF